METLWFMIVAVMVAAYAVLDGFDLGAGAIYLGAGRTRDDRRKILRAIGPVMKYGFWRLAGRCISPSRCSMLPVSAVSICRS
jgi:cytochrome d ubiquinol oxidase subunit II